MIGPTLFLIVGFHNMLLSMVFLIFDMDSQNCRHTAVFLFPSIFVIK